MALAPWIIAIIVIVIVLFVSAFGFLAWAFFFRRKKQYPFLLYSRNLKNAREVYAAIKVDPENKENKVFTFSGVDSKLAIREPSLFIGSKSYRQIIQNQNGGYSYIDGITLDEANYLKLSLSPDEKSLALHRIKENHERNANPVSKTQAAMLITGFIMVIILAIGIIYSTIAYVGAGKNVVKVVETNKANINSMNAVTSRLADISEQQAQITGALTKGRNITRQIS